MGNNRFCFIGYGSGQLDESSPHSIDHLADEKNYKIEIPGRPTARDVPKKDITNRISEMTDGFSLKGTARIWVEEPQEAQE